jgi:molybdopterin converting factor small subunit
MNSSLDKDKIIETQGELIKKLQKQVKEWEDWKASSEERHVRGKANLTNLKNKNTLRFKTTRKPKK